MKRILIVEVPDEFKVTSVSAKRKELSQGLDDFKRLQCTEFILPTDEEIEKANFTEGDEYAEQSYLLAEGAKWFKNLLQ